MTVDTAVRPNAHTVDKTIRGALVLAGVGGVVWVVGLVFEPRRAIASYLFAYATVFTIVVGALMQVMISYLTGARWFTVLRRLALYVAGAMPAVVLLLLPLLFGGRILYSWVSPVSLAPQLRAVIARKEIWLNWPFFVSRAIAYVVVWWFVGAVVRRYSLRQDHATGRTVVGLVRSERRASAVGLIAVGWAFTFASFDWLMSLEPAWYSTIYGVYLFAGGLLAALGLIAVLAYAAAAHGRVLSEVITPEHFGALGKLLLTFVMFWGYIAFSQYLIIWIGDIPAEASWYVVRTTGGWGVLALVVAIGQFAIPFLVLLPWALKRRSGVIVVVGGWLLIMHVLDIYWLIMPAVYPAGLRSGWLDLAALLLVGGAAGATMAWRARGHPVVPIGDPYLDISTRYVEP